MNKDFLKMQKLAGLITENQFKQLAENLDVEAFKREATKFINKHKDIIDTAIDYYNNPPDDSYEESQIQTIYDFLTDEIGEDWTEKMYPSDPEDKKYFNYGWTDEKDEIFTRMLKNIIK